MCLFIVLFIVVAVIIIVKVGVTIPYFFLGFLLYIQVNIIPPPINMAFMITCLYYIIQISSLAVASFTQPFRLYTDVVSA